jgi:hypothetical protein
MLYSNSIMAITIDNSEIEAIIQRRLQTGAFETVDQVLLDALSEDNAWENPGSREIVWLDEKLKRSIAPLDRGEGIAPEELRRLLNADREAWLTECEGAPSFRAFAEGWADPISRPRISSAKTRVKGERLSPSARRNLLQRRSTHAPHHPLS